MLGEGPWSAGPPAWGPLSGSKTPQHLSSWAEKQPPGCSASVSPPLYPPPLSLSLPSLFFLSLLYPPLSFSPSFSPTSVFLLVGIF